MSNSKTENQLPTKSEDYVLPPSVRQKTLTEKGYSLYESKVQKFTTTFDRIWKDIEAAIFDYNSKESELEPKVLQHYQEDIGCLRQELIESSDILTDFLIRTNTAESSEERVKHLDMFTRRKDLVDRFVAAISERILEAADNISCRMASEHKSRNSKRSVSSQSQSTSNVLLEKQLNVERQKTRLEFLKHELTLEKRKSQLELDLRLLKQEKETAIAEAEVEITRKHMAPEEFHSLGEAQSLIPKEEILSRFLSSLDSQSTQTSFVKLPPPKFVSTPYEPLYAPPHEPVPEATPTEPPKPTVMSNPNPVILFT